MDERVTSFARAVHRGQEVFHQGDGRDAASMPSSTPQFDTNTTC
jgi:hypothetical protein